MVSPAVLSLAAAALLLAPLAGPLAATEPETSASRPTLGTHAPGFKLRDQHGRVAKKYGVLRSLGVMEVALIIDPKGAS